MTEALPKILCVDDEANVLDGLRRQLRRKYHVDTATSGSEGLSAMAEHGPYAVVVSDMRMPLMDGAQFLAKARTSAPDTVRLLLTGHADLDAATRAVNEGHIFRFLSKPCPPELLASTIDAAVEQHHLRVAERELLEQTLRGSLSALSEVLSLAAPRAFGRARRIQRTAVAVAKALGCEDVWRVEVAALMSQLGAVTLPPDTLERWDRGATLSPEESEMLTRFPAVADALLGHIPRLEEVRALVHLASLAPAEWTRARPSASAHALRAAEALEGLTAQRVPSGDAVDLVDARKQHPAEVIAALRAVCGSSESGRTLKEVSPRMLIGGMVLDQDLCTRDGTLLVTRGHEVSESLLLRLRNLLHRNALPDSIRVLVRQ